MIFQDFREKYETVIIYDNIPKGAEMVKYKNGLRVG